MTRRQYRSPVRRQYPPNFRKRRARVGEVLQDGTAEGGIEPGSQCAPPATRRGGSCRRPHPRPLRRNGPRQPLTPACGRCYAREVRDVLACGPRAVARSGCGSVERGSSSRYARRCSCICGTGLYTEKPPIRQAWPRARFVTKASGANPPKQGPGAAATSGRRPFQIVQEASTARSCRYHRGVDMTPLNTNDKKLRQMEQGDNARWYRARSGLTLVGDRGTEEAPRYCLPGAGQGRF